MGGLLDIRQNLEMLSRLEATFDNKQGCIPDVIHGTIR